MFLNGHVILHTHFAKNALIKFVYEMLYVHFVENTYCFLINVKEARQKQHLQGVIFIILCKDLIRLAKKLNFYSKNSIKP